MSEFYLLPPAGHDSGHANKDVELATLRVEDSEAHPQRNRHVVAVDTSDGWTYRFQRWDWDEPLVLLDRTRPDGTENQQNAKLPGNVEKFVEAVDQGDVEPTTAPEAEDVYGIGEGRGRAIADGSGVVEEGDEAHVFGSVFCPTCGQSPFVQDEHDDGRASYQCRENHTWTVKDGREDVFVDGEAENCPCGGTLRYADHRRVPVVCEGCGRDFEHWKDDTQHYLVVADPGTSEGSPPVVAREYRDEYRGGAR